ncbi:hypothetical protein H6G91_31955 [Nostoc muscorum FACHB-395]|nr:hypothetical protein [Desmonostoc muscorum FACHB-395]
MAVCVSSYEDIRILTHIIGSFGHTCISIGDVYDGLRLRLIFKIVATRLAIALIHIHLFL